MTTNAMKEYFEVTTFHGLGDLVRPAAVGVKLLWVAVIVAAFTYCGIEISKTLIDYSQKYTTTKIETENMADVPSIRACQRITDGLGERVEGFLESNRFENKSVCGGMLGNTELGNFMTFVNLIDYVYGDDPKSSIPLEILKEKIANVELPDDANDYDLSLDGLAEKFGPVLNIEPSEITYPCVKELLEYLKAKNFNDMVLKTSVIVELDVDYVIGKRNMSRGARGEIKLDNYGGICETFTFDDQAVVSSGLYEFTGLSGRPVEFQFFLGNSTVTHYFELGAGDLYTTIVATATKFTRQSGCSTIGTASRYEDVNACRNVVISEFEKCCLCGITSSTCPLAEAPCCTELHLAKATKRGGDFQKRWNECHESMDKSKMCAETKYSSSIGAFQGSTKEETLNFKIRLMITNTDNVLVLKEIPLLTGNAVLGNVGGVLGLFVGGSIMSLIQMVMFCIDRVFRLCRGRHPPTGESG